MNKTDRRSPAKTYSRARRWRSAASARRRRRRGPRAALSQWGIPASTAQTFARDSSPFCLWVSRKDAIRGGGGRRGGCDPGGGERTGKDNHRRRWRRRWSQFRAETKNTGRAGRVGGGCLAAEKRGKMLVVSIRTVQTKQVINS